MISRNTHAFVLSSKPGSRGGASDELALHLWIYAQVLASLVALASPAPAQSTSTSSDILKHSREMLQTATEDKNPDIRKGAVEALSLVGVSDPLFDSLASMLDDRDVVVRVTVVTTLGDLKNKQTVPLLKKALSDPVPEVSFAAAKALYQLHDPDGRRVLLAVISGEEKASSNFVTKEERSALRMLHTPTKLFAAAAIGAVGFVPMPGLGLGVSSAQGILLASDSSARAAALLLMGNDRDSSLVPVVESALSDKEWSVRAAAVQLVAMHPFPALRDNLKFLLDDKNVEVRLRAAAAYIRLQRGPAPATHHAKPVP